MDKYIQCILSISSNRQISASKKKQSTCQKYWCLDGKSQTFLYRNIATIGFVNVYILILTAVRDGYSHVFCPLGNHVYPGVWLKGCKRYIAKTDHKVKKCR